MYYGSKISDNMTKMPEGFLLCQNVPIGRTGSQEYLGQELGLEYGMRCEVLREEAEVFAVAAIASFEGKPFTDEHPPSEVTPENASQYIKGVVRNVRRGEGEQADLLLADILVYDKEVIAEIERGKREVSCGYNCQYEQTGENQYKQTNIIGNHVALVEKGRAGGRVAIKDEKPNRRREKRMGQQTKKSVLGRMFGGFAQDATPEELELALDAMTKACEDEEPEQTPATEPVKEVQDEGEGNPLEERLDRLEAMVGKLVQAMQPQKEPDALDALEAELSQAPKEEGTDEESVTVEPEQVNKPENTATDHAALLEQIGALKPIVAQISNPTQRRKTADTLAHVLRQGAGVVPGNNNEYLQVYQSAMKQAEQSRKTMDATLDERSFGREIARKYNPHYKEDK